MKKADIVLVLVSLFLAALATVIFIFSAEEAWGETVAIINGDGIKIMEGRVKDTLPPLPKGVDISPEMVVALYTGKEKSYVHHNEVPGLRMLSIFPPLRERKLERTEIFWYNGEWKKVSSFEAAFPAKNTVPVFILSAGALFIFGIAAIGGSRNVKITRFLFLWLTIFASVICATVSAIFVSSKVITGFATLICFIAPIFGGKIAAGEDELFEIGSVLGAFSGLSIAVCVVPYRDSYAKFFIDSAGFLLAASVLSFVVFLLFRKIRFGKTAEA